MKAEETANAETGDVKPTEEPKSEDSKTPETPEEDIVDWNYWGGWVNKVSEVTNSAVQVAKSKVGLN